MARGHKQHHTVAAMYLRGFARTDSRGRDWVEVLDLRAGEWRRQRPIKICHQARFYRVDVPGFDPNVVETEILGKVESEAAPVVRRLTEAAVRHVTRGAQPPDLSAREAGVLISFVALRRRAELVSAALTILRWHRKLSDSVPRGALRFAGFEPWCRVVRDPLMALGHADAVIAVQAGRSSDPEREQLAALLAAWADKIGDQPLTAAEVGRRAEARSSMNEPVEPALADAVAAVAGDAAGRINMRRLGNFLARGTDRIIDGRMFKREGAHNRSVRWTVRGTEL